MRRTLDDGLKESRWIVFERGERQEGMNTPPYHEERENTKSNQIEFWVYLSSTGRKNRQTAQGNKTERQLRRP